jgi:hypothetical protein
MSGDDLTEATVHELVSRYAEAAAAHVAASEQGDHRRANPQHDVLAAIYRELRRRDEAEALLPLLALHEPAVRSWAGAHALEFSPDEGERVLEALASETGLVGFNAQMTLETWREGELRFP